MNSHRFQLRPSDGAFEEVDEADDVGDGPNPDRYYPEPTEGQPTINPMGPYANVAALATLSHASATGSPTARRHARRMLLFVYVAPWMLFALICLWAIVRS